MLWPGLPLARQKEPTMITLQEQIAEAQRELALRHSAYPKWIKAGKLDAGPESEGRRSGQAGRVLRGSAPMG